MTDRNNWLNLSLEQGDSGNVEDLSETYIFEVLIGHDQDKPNKKMANNSDDCSNGSGSSGSGSHMYQSSALRLVETIIRVVPTFSGVIPAEQTGTFMRTLLTRLSGQARELVSHEEIENWEDLKKILDASYIRPKNPAYLQCQLFTARQKYKEPMVEYVNRLNHLMRQVNSCSTIGKTKEKALTIKETLREQVLNVFLEGLADSVQTMVKSQHPKTLEEAIKIAIEEEENFLARLEKKKESQEGKNANKDNYKNKDTGSSVNIIQLQCLKDEVKLLPGDKIYLKGINNTLVETIGIVEIPLTFGTFTIKKIPFYIVKDDVPLIKSGILGQIFLKEHKALIDMANDTIVINQVEKAMKIPPRVEHIMAVKINDANLKSDETILINKAEITDQVYVGNVINKIQNNEVLIKIINLSEEEKQISHLKLTDLDYEIYNEVEMNIIDSTDLIQKEVNNLERFERLKQELRVEQLNKEEQESVYNICAEYTDIFYLEGDKLTSTSSIMHEIKTPIDNAPIYQRQYRLPHSQREEINKQINKMYDEGIIEPSNSPWNSPMLLVPKKLDATGKPKYRLVVDYRKLNNITVGDKMPLPQIRDVLDRLGNSKYFTVLDLASGFHQIPLEKSSRIKSAFSSNIGHWQYTKLPMGLKNSPPTFQRLMNNVLCNLIGLQCLVYLDDIIIFSVDIREHSKRLREVFNRLRMHILKLNPAKCEFLSKEVIYLGHKISENGVQPDERKVESVKNFPIPKNVKDIKSFLGLTGYYRNFIPDYSKISKPLTNLLKKDVKFDWSATCNEAFDSLKTILCKEPILQFPDFTKPFTITCDASNYAVGSVLSQGEGKHELPIAYSSRTLNKAEINYTTTEKELVAILFGVKQYRPYIYGRRFCIVTDHKPLT
ncbi:hypothetical protein QTP88_015627 [Uroleucon formosanum]